MEAIGGTTKIKKENLKKVKNSKTIRNILGIEREIAYKNLRRNKKRFIITVFSMVISISPIYNFLYFSDFIFKIGAVQGKGMGDFNISGDMEGKSHEIYNKLKEVKAIKRLYKLSSDTGELLLNDKQINNKMIEMVPYMFDDKKAD